MTSRRAKKWDWRTNSKEMLSWIAEAFVGSPSAWDETDDEEEIDPIAVMGRTDTRSNWVGAITPKGNRGTKSPQHPDLARRYFISREQSPVCNFFEKKKPEWTREQQIDAYRDYVWNEWLQKGRCPTVLTVGCVRVRCRGDCWQNHRLGFRLPRVQQKKNGGASSAKALLDCHGHVVRALILIKAGQITREDYFATRLNTS